jgi:hypothetical protein
MTSKVQWKVKDFSFPSNHHHVAIKGDVKNHQNLLQINNRQMRTNMYVTTHTKTSKPITP